MISFLTLFIFQAYHFTSSHYPAWPLVRQFVPSPLRLPAPLSVASASSDPLACISVNANVLSLAYMVVYMPPDLRPLFARRLYMYSLPVRSPISFRRLHQPIKAALRAAGILFLDTCLSPYSAMPSSSLVPPRSLLGAAAFSQARHMSYAFAVKLFRKQPRFTFQSSSIVLHLEHPLCV